MATAGGPDIERDGLVFGMDTGYGIDTNNISSRFYPGEPTTNLVTSPFEINNTTSTDIPQELVGKGITGYASYNSNYSVFTISTTSTSSTGKTFQYSIWMRSPGGVSTYLLYVYDGTGPDGGWWSFGEGALTDEWQRITGSRSNMTGTVSSIRVYRRNQQGTIEMVAPQLEVNSHVTPFLTGTRSSTQSLIDLTKTTNIDVSNVSFDSTGQPTFDGTDDRIDITSNLGTLSAYTFEYVAQSNSAGNMPVSSRTSTAFYKYGAYSWRYTHGGVASEFYHTYGADTGWAHWVITYDGSTITVYENNISKGTRASTGTADFTGGIRIGSWTSATSYTWDGQIPVLKVYNRALSAQEVQQNYNAYKNRFNL